MTKESTEQLHGINEDKLDDHDLLLVVCTRQLDQIKHFENHLKHHFVITLAAISAGFMGTASFVVGLLLLFATK